MKKTILNIASICLAVLVLISTLSVTVEKHYCMGQLADYSILTSVEGCEMPMPNDKEGTVTKVPCCNDVVELVEGTNTELKIAKEFSFDEVQFAAVFFTSFVNLFEGLPENVIPHKNHSPPLLTKDIQLLYETYLI